MMVQVNHNRTHPIPYPPPLHYCRHRAYPTMLPPTAAAAPVPPEPSPPTPPNPLCFDFSTFNILSLQFQHFGIQMLNIFKENVVYVCKLIVRVGFIHLQSKRFKFQQP